MSPRSRYGGQMRTVNRGNGAGGTAKAVPAAGVRHGRRSRQGAVALGLAAGAAAAMAAPATAFAATAHGHPENGSPVIGHVACVRQRQHCRGYHDRRVRPARQRDADARARLSVPGRRGRDRGRARLSGLHSDRALRAASSSPPTPAATRSRSCGSGRTARCGWSGTGSPSQAGARRSASPCTAAWSTSPTRVPPAPTSPGSASPPAAGTCSWSWGRQSPGQQPPAR